MARPKKSKPNHATGMYEYKATVGRTFEGKAIRKSFYSAKSLEDAKEKARLYMVEREVRDRTGEKFVSGAVSFRAWAEKWLEIYKRPNVKEHTFKWTYETNVKNHFIPHFGDAPIKNIRQIDVQNYFNSKKGLSMTTLQRQKTILFDIFDTAIDNDLCYKNPVKNIRLSSDKADFEKRWYDKTQADKLRTRALADDTKYARAVCILLGLGLRRGELLGLMWDDIDAESRTVHIRRSIEPDTKGLPKDGEVKSKSSLRDIPYTDKVFAEFLARIKREEHASRFVLSGRTKYGYTSIYGFDKGYKLYMQKTAEQLGLPYMTPHELRHSYGTILREQGLDLLSISKLMGHSDTTVTEKNYIGNDIEVLRKRLSELDSTDI